MNEALIGALAALAGVALGPLLTTGLETRTWRRDRRADVYASLVAALEQARLGYQEMENLDPQNDLEDALVADVMAPALSAFAAVDMLGSPRVVRAARAAISEGMHFVGSPPGDPLHNDHFAQAILQMRLMMRMEFAPRLRER